MTAVSSRRERLRAATLTEIKDVARRLLVTEGVEAMSLRGIAREMGMTAPAIYRYFESREDLLAALVTDLYHELSGALEAARDALPPDDLAGRLMATSRVFRRWSLDHPAEFALVFGRPLPSYEVPQEGPLREADARFEAVFAVVFAELWARRPFPVAPESDIDPRLAAQLAEYGAARGGALPVGALKVFLECWARLYGQICLEVFGHLAFALPDPEPMFEDMLRDLGSRLGLGADYRPPA